MPKYDIPGREGPLTLGRHHEWREFRLERPVETDDPIVVKLRAAAGIFPEPAGELRQHLCHFLLGRLGRLNIQHAVIAHGAPDGDGFVVQGSREDRGVF